MGTDDLPPHLGIAGHGDERRMACFTVVIVLAGQQPGSYLLTNLVSNSYPNPPTRINQSRARRRNLPGRVVAPGRSQGTVQRACSSGARLRIAACDRARAGGRRRALGGRLRPTGARRHGADARRPVRRRPLRAA